MSDEASMASHLNRFYELIAALEAAGEGVDNQRQLVILLGSLPIEYELIVSIIESMNSVSLNEVKEKLIKTYEKLQQG